MKRVKQFGSVTFGRNTLFVREFEEGAGVIAEARKSAAGTDIVFVAADNTPARTLDGKRYGVIDETQRETLMSMFASLGTTYTLTYDDDSTETVRFAHERASQFKLTPLYEGSKKFTVVIPLAKV